MATKKVSKIQKTADKLKVQAKQMHDTALVTSDSLVESSIVTGEKWQKLMAKALKDGTVLFGKQQDMMLDTLETLKGQYLHGNARLRKLFGIKAPSFAKAVEEAAKPAAAKMKAAKETTKMAKEIAKVGLKKAKKAVTGSKAKTKKAVKATASKAAKVTTKKKATASKAVKATTKKAKSVTVKKKVTAKKVATKKTAVKKSTSKDNLTKIEGIGPKIEQLLNKAGIRTFKMLGTVDVKTLRAILDKAGPRYKMHNPKTWRQQAKLAATGKWEKLNDLQKNLKGGVKVKK